MTTDIITPLAAEQSDNSATNLALVRDTMTEFDKVQAGVATLAAKYSGVAFAVDTPKGLAEARDARTEIRAPRYAVDKALKAAKAPLNALKKNLDERAKYITDQIMQIEEPVHAQIRAEEERREAAKEVAAQAERERIAAIAVKLAAIRANEVVLAGTPSAEIEAVVARMSAAVPTEAEFGDMHEAAMRAHDETLLRLRHHITAAQTHEARQRAVAEQQAELARRQEAQRVAAAAAAAAAKAEADRLTEERREFEAKQAAAQAEAKRLDDQRKQREAERLAEQEAFAAKVREFEQKQAEATAALERDRVEAEADIARQHAEWEARIAPASPVLIDKAVADANARSWVDTFAPDNGVCGSRPLVDEQFVCRVDNENGVDRTPVFFNAAVEQPAPTEERPTLKLGEIVASLGFVVTSKFLADLGFPAADIPGINAKLYKPSEFGAICRTLIAHIARVADEFAEVNHE